MFKSSIVFALMVLVLGFSSGCATFDKVKSGVTQRFDRDAETDGGSLQSVEQTAEPAKPEQKPLLVEVQEKLITLGYQPGSTNGQLDARTEAAIQDFQLDHDLRINGRPSKALLEEIDKALEFI